MSQDIATTLTTRRMQAASKGATKMSRILEDRAEFIGKRIKECEKLADATQEAMDLTKSGIEIMAAFDRTLESSGKLLINKSRAVEDTKGTPTQEEIMTEMMKGKK